MSQLSPASSESRANEIPSTTRRIRLWPAVVIVAVQWIASLAAAQFANGEMIHFYASFMGPVVASGLIILWWLFFSRVPWRDRLVVLGIALAAGGVLVLLDTNPHMGFFKIMLYAAPAAMGLGVLWLLLTGRFGWMVRRLGLVAIIVGACGYYTLLRMDGVRGDMTADMNWRWVPTREQKFIAELAPVQRDTIGRNEVTQPLVLQPGDWPGFRGPDRDGRLRGVGIVTDWAKDPPKKLWKRKVGPGWSSMTIIGKRLFTQEQYDQQEAVICYDADSGEMLWKHLDAARFWEPVGGAGPRATPTFHEGKLYTVGGKGKLNCLDAATGKLHWERDIAADTGAKVPEWGFASSPLVLSGLVSVFAGGPDGKSVQAYQLDTGAPAWVGGQGTHAYTSPHRAVIGGVEQLLVLSDHGLTSFEPASGKVLWASDWPEKIQRVVQPALLGGDDVLLGTPFGFGSKRIHVDKTDAGWTTKEVWSTRFISPYFNDLVVHQDHLYGFDNNFLACLSIADGKRRWKERGYGNGQVLLLVEQSLLLVLAESGEVALVAAQPDKLHEIARFQAIEGKSWNHPAIAHGRLFVRNGEEMACFALKELPFSREPLAQER
jgi:outer membrane protein assembly factor BamB